MNLRTIKARAERQASQERHPSTLIPEQDFHAAVAAVLASAEVSIATLPDASPAREMVRSLAMWRALFVCLRKSRPWDLPAVEAKLREYCRHHGLPERVAELLIADEPAPSLASEADALPSLSPTEMSATKTTARHHSAANNGRKLTP